MDEAPSPQAPYRARLVGISEALPHLASALITADENRRNSLARLSNGARLRGADALLSYLSKVGRTYREADSLRRVAFLVERAEADFRTAVEAALSGYPAVAADSMRDVMEIELLLLDFVRDSANLETWLTAEERTRRRIFAPVKLRERLTEAGVDAYTSTAGKVDYAAHSESLHVNPNTCLFPQRGVKVDDPNDLLTDGPWWEIFEHAHRLVLAIEALRMRFEVERGSEALCDLNLIWDARERTQTMQTMYLALLTGPVELRQSLRREPTTVEVLEYARDRVAQLAPAEREQHDS